MLASVVRLAIAGWILVALGRASRGAWQHRRLVLAIWSRVRPAHLFGAAGLLAAVVVVAGALITHVPGMDLGLGTLVGTSSNAVFTPLEEVVARTGPSPVGGPDWQLLAVSSAFLLPLLALLPWLAFVEEEVFRAGLEEATIGQELRSALVFGLVHLVMLVPLGAAVAVGGCGWVYGRVYRAAHARSDGADVPVAALRSYRPTRRARAAAERARTPDAVLATARVLVADHSPERRQADAVLSSSVWHTTFNSMVVLLVWAALVVAAL